MTCELKGCRFWRESDQGCNGEACWPLFGWANLGMEVITVAHRCCGYRPADWPAGSTWWWPGPGNVPAPGLREGSPEAVKMWLDAGLPEDFTLPKAEGV